MTYTVFIGLWDEPEPDFTILRLDGLSWDEAREKISESLSAFKDDECEVCREHAQSALDLLGRAQSGRFAACVDGNDYLIMPRS